MVINVKRYLQSDLPAGANWATLTRTTLIKGNNILVCLLFMKKKKKNTVQTLVRKPQADRPL